MTEEKTNTQPEPIASTSMSDGHMSDITTPANKPGPLERSKDMGQNENDESSAQVQDEAGVVDNDDSWLGEGPSPEIQKIVRDELGEKVASVFTTAYRQMNGAGDNVARVIAATSTFVTALKSVPEDLQMKGAYGELSLAHGRSLIRFVELEGTGSTAVAAKIVKALQTAASANHVAGGNANAENEEEDEEEGDEDGEEDIGKDGDEDEDIETAWTQLEVARVIFSREGWKVREAECRYSLGQLLLACDEGKKAAAEFSSAAELFDCKRRQAECYYRKYLSLRNADRTEAAAGLKEAVNIYEEIDASDDVFADMKAELQDLLDAIKDSGETAAVQAKQPTVVQVVTPKRKRDVQSEKVVSDDGKKARVEAPPALTK